MSESNRDFIIRERTQMIFLLDIIYIFVHIQISNVFNVLINKISSISIYSLFCDIDYDYVLS